MENLDELRREIEDLVARDQVRIPPYPAVAFRIEQLIRADDFGLEELARLVASDQRIAADVLRVANTTFYARSGPVPSVRQAVTAIGAKGVAQIAVAAGLGAEASAPGPLAVLRRQAWVDALASAFLCQALSPDRGLPAEVAFSAGLLHDIGRIVAIAAVEHVLSRRRDASAHSAADWSAVVDALHIGLGLAVATRWKLPAILTDVVANHHAVTLAAPEHAALVEAVAAVHGVTELLREGISLEPADLARAPLLRPTEYGPILDGLGSLAEFVASFEALEPTRASAPPAPSLVTPELPPPDRERKEGPPPPPIPAFLKLGGRKVECRFLGIAPTHCVLSAPEGLPENQLLGLEIPSTPPVNGFAWVKVSWPEAGATSMLVQPYALSKDALGAWNTLAHVTEQDA
jgi:HD-like signal output (HDOD) protein